MATIDLRALYKAQKNLLYANCWTKDVWTLIENIDNCSLQIIFAALQKVYLIIITLSFEECIFLEWNLEHDDHVNQTFWKCTYDYFRGRKGGKQQE